MQRAAASGFDLRIDNLPVIDSAGDEKIAAGQEIAEARILIGGPVWKENDIVLITLKQHAADGGGNGGKIFHASAAHLEDKTGIRRMGDKNIQMA